MSHDFATELRTHRERSPRWSRERLARESGVSLPGIEYIETNHPTSKRETVIKLAWPMELAGKWTVAAALESAGEPALTQDERDALLAPAASTHGVSLADLARYWDDIPEREREALLILAAAAAAGSYSMIGDEGPDPEVTTVDGATVVRPSTGAESRRDR